MDEIKMKAIQQLIKIRDTAKFNMFTERSIIMQYANENNMFSLVSYVGNDKDAYLQLLKDMDKVDLN